VVEAVNTLKVRSCLVDGALRRRQNEARAFLFAFDLLELDGTADAPYEIEEVRDVYPLHPRCRCAVYPWEDLRFKGNDAFNPYEERDPHGRWIGSGTHSSGTHSEPVGPGYSANAHVIDGVIHTSSVYDAQRALFENRRVELSQIKQVSTLIQRLGETAAEMAEAGETAPVFNLCNVSVKGTNLFCAEPVRAMRPSTTIGIRCGRWTTSRRPRCGWPRRRHTRSTSTVD
jgi:hypothetical protein